MKLLFTIKMPIPPLALRPNGRPHWAVKAKASRIQRTEAKLRTLQVSRKLDLTGEKVLHIKNTWFKKTKTRMDGDNASASLKAARDGIAEALGVNDSIFVNWPTKFEVDKENPRVMIEVYIDN